MSNVTFEHGAVSHAVTELGFTNVTLFWCWGMFLSPVVSYTELLCSLRIGNPLGTITDLETFKPHPKWPKIRLELLNHWSPQSTQSPAVPFFLAVPRGAVWGSDADWHCCHDWTAPGLHLSQGWSHLSLSLPTTFFIHLQSTRSPVKVGISPINPCFHFNHPPTWLSTSDFCCNQRC